MIKKLFFATMLFVLAFNDVIAQSTDPWIIDVYYNEWFRKPDDLEKNIKNYNGGTWGSKEELRKYIIAFQKSKVDNNIWFEIIPLKDKSKAVVIAHQDNQPAAAAVVSTANGTLISHDGGSIVAGGAGNLIGQDGAGLSDRVKNLGSLQYGSSRTILSESVKPIKSGKGALVITKKKK